MQKKLLSVNNFKDMVYITEPSSNGRGDYSYSQQFWSERSNSYLGKCRFQGREQGFWAEEEGCNLNCPQISPNGQMAACIALMPDGSKALWIYDLLQQKRTNIININDVEEFVWSADSRSICMIIVEKEPDKDGIRMVDSVGYRSNEDKGIRPEKRYILMIADIQNGKLKSLLCERKPLKKVIWMKTEDAVIVFSGETQSYLKVNVQSKIRTVLCSGLIMASKWSHAVLTQNEKYLFVPTSNFDNGSGQCSRLTCVETDGTGVVSVKHNGQIPQEWVPAYSDGDILETKNDYMGTSLESEAFFAVGERGGVSGIYCGTYYNGEILWKRICEGGVFTALTVVDKDTLLTVWSDADMPPELYKVGISCGEMKKVTDANAWTEKYALAPQTRICVEVGTATKLYGYYMLPPMCLRNQVHDKLPVVLTVHGGPASSYCGGFFMERQLLAAQGYCVVYGDPRGSTGYGEDFARADYAFDGTAASDLMVLLDYVLEKIDMLDKSRQAVIGGSYGGYMTVWLAAHEKRFKTACALRGLFSYLDLTLLSEGAGQVPFGADTSSVLGEFIRDSVFLEGRKITIPLLICHGEKDMVCPVEGAYRLYAAVRDNQPQVPVELNIFKDCKHAIDPQSAENSIKFYDAVLSWLIKYL